MGWLSCKNVSNRLANNNLKVSLKNIHAIVNIKIICCNSNNRSPPKSLGALWEPQKQITLANCGIKAFGDKKSALDKQAGSMLKQQIQYSKPWTKDRMSWSIKFRYPTDSLAAICWQWIPPSWHMISHRSTHICCGKQSKHQGSRRGSPLLQAPSLLPLGAC